ncbi:MAG: NUDIX hydrolase [Pararhizobium sp.]
MHRERAVIPVEEVVLSLAAGPHPYEVANRRAALEAWQAEVRVRPFLFDGQVALASDCDLAGGVFRATCHLVSYSTFLHWRANRPVAGAIHIFAMPLIVSADGAVVAIRMSERTANAGRIYCPCGSLDDSDVVDGRFDVAGNMLREVAEETGLDLGEAEADLSFNALPLDGAVAIFRVYRFAQNAADLVARMEEHARREPDPEISEVVAVWSEADITADFQFHMPAILDWYFNERRDTPRIRAAG